MNFPRLKTGAVGQYPTRRRLEYRTEVLHFVDGSEQRYRLASGPLRSWRLSFHEIDEQEATALANFFEVVHGGFGSFVFEDPWEGRRYEECSFGRDELELGLEGESRIRSEVEVRENRR